ANHGQPIDEGQIGGWLDQIYAGDIALRWVNEYERAAREFRASVITPLRAFQSDDDLEELFYKAFDSVEVLPITLYDEYEQLKQTEPIRANELLVSISWRRWHALARDGRVLPREKRQPYVVDVPYTSELGMYFGDS
ncbi:MAG: hypothetical protein KDE20_14635, partial [Caldilineaceae bacterium]|nr:hypothetical protein [Caldilineaceae bacterium]